MILLTGATGATGRRVLDRLLSRGHRVRCLVRNPARLGSRRADVEPVLWNLTDTRLPGGALRGVRTVIHLAGPLSDQPIGQLEELNATASWRLADAAASAGVEHVVHVSALGAGGAAGCRFLRAKEVGERVVIGAGATGGMGVSVVAPSLILARGQRWASWAQALALLPIVPVPARSSHGRSRPLSAADVADAILAVVEGETPAVGHPARHELAGPDEYAVRDLVPALHEVVARRRPTVALPSGILNAAVAVLERPGAADREELAVLGCDTAGRHGTRDLEALGVRPGGIVEALAG